MRSGTIGKSFTVDMDHHNCSANSSKWLEMAHGCDHDVEDGHDHSIIHCNVSRMPRSSLSDTNESTFTGNAVEAGPLNGKPVRVCFPANSDSLLAATAGPSTSGSDQTESGATTGESQGSMRNSLFETKPDRDRMHRKVMKTSFIIIFTTFAFLFQWLIVNLLVALDFPAGIPSELRVLAMVLSYIPAALDPIIWIYTIAAIRRHTRNVFQMFRTHCYKCFSGVTGQADGRE
ncbi:uncharacterized protein [Ptychodera flava]|uniref:uncharacterized protein isoform X2 n=1 Tax=Ptychodera flava TaxID=63121 RepID=UPI00396A9A47